MNRAIARELVAMAKELLAMEFPTQDALDKYLKEHPDADRSNHSVKETEEDVRKKIRETPEEVEERLKKQMGDQYKSQEQRIRGEKEKWDKKMQNLRETK